MTAIPFAPNLETFSCVIKLKKLQFPYGDDDPIQSVRIKSAEVTVRCRLTPKETESWSYRVNVAVCLAALEERTLHQLQLRPKRLMGKTAQQESRVRRPLSARANWSLWPELTPTSLWRNTYTCMEQLWQESSIKSHQWSRRPLLWSWRSVSPLWACIATRATYSDSWAGLVERLLAFDLELFQFSLLSHFCTKSEKVKVFRGVKIQWHVTTGGCCESPA